MRQMIQERISRWLVRDASQSSALPSSSSRTRALALSILMALVLTVSVQMWREQGPILNLGTWFKEESSLDQEEEQAADVEESDLLNLKEDLLNVYSPERELIGPAAACHPNVTANVKKGTMEYEFLSADCGLGYNYLNSTSSRTPWKVALYGGNFINQILGLSGCLVGVGKCPWSPKCRVIQTENEADARSADVVVIFQNDHQLINRLPKRKGQYRVLYWREAFYQAPPVAMQKKFDFQMGVHWFSGVLNPQFFRTPAALLGGITYPHKQVIPFLPAEKRKHFAMAIMSNCHTASLRHVYVNRLAHYLGASRIHQYGKCGNMKLPPPPIKNAAKIIADYKFYLSFENTIEDGYVTEKLLHVLAMPVVPVYYGSLYAPNITTIPSYIRVADFSHPKLLADYLLFLDQNHDEYYKYHLWRTNPRLFNPEYLKIMQMKSPGPYEMLPLRNRGSGVYPRSAACCRLCDENYVKYAAESRDHFVEGRLGHVSIERRFYQGDFGGEPKKQT